MKFPEFKKALPTFSSIQQVLRQQQFRKADEVKKLEEELPPSKKGLAVKLAKATTDYLTEAEQRVTDDTRVRGILAGDGIRPLHFPSLEVDYLPWAQINGDLYGVAGCGPCLLAGVTHTNPVEIRALMIPLVKKYFPEAMTGRNLDGVPEELMRLFFNAFGIHMIPYTRNDLCPKRGQVKKPITKKHVVLHAAHFAKGVMSWIIYFGGKCYHNNVITETDELDIINFVPDSTYILFSPLWRFESKAYLDFGLEPADPPA